MKARPPLPADIKQLMALVRAGKLFDVQKWIADGKRSVPPKPYWFSPLRVAVETGFHSMVEVLLQAGVDQDEKDYLFNRTVWSSTFELIKLFVDHGADVHAVDFVAVCQTGNPEIMRFFLDRGIDAVTGQPFAKALCHPKRPQLGICLRYRETIPDLTNQLNLALRHHAREGSLKWVFYSCGLAVTLMCDCRTWVEKPIPRAIRPRSKKRCGSAGMPSLTKSALIRPETI